VPPKFHRAGQPQADGTPKPFAYSSDPWGLRDLELERMDTLQQISSCAGFSCPQGDWFDPVAGHSVIGLSFTNYSRNRTGLQVPWGPSLRGHFSTDTPQATPNLQAYLYRRDPGGDAVLIGASGIKAFWSSIDSDYQFVAPFSFDVYGNGNNSERRSFAPDDAVDGVTGERTDYSGMGTRDNHGVWILSSRTFTHPWQNLLVVPLAEIDPALHPGASYYLAGNIFELGDNNVANNSRWNQYTVTRTTGNRFNFGLVAGGRLDICTMPGRPAVGRCATGGPGVPGGEEPGGEAVPLPDAGEIVASTVLARPVAPLALASPPQAQSLPEREPELQPVDWTLAAAQPEPAVADLVFAETDVPAAQDEEVFFGLTLRDGMC
jgi:hypothetical protein